MESIITAVIVFLMCIVISFLVATLIKSIFICIKLNESYRARNEQGWKGSTLTSKPLS